MKAEKPSKQHLFLERSFTQRVCEQAKQCSQSYQFLINNKTYPCITHGQSRPKETHIFRTKTFIKREMLHDLINN